MGNDNIAARDRAPAFFHLPSFRAGMLAVLPGMVGVIPFGVITGVLMPGVGVSFFDGLGMTLALYSGAAQVAVLDLMGRGASMAVMIFTGLIINLRFIMYSATLGPYLKGLSAPRKVLSAYIMSDQSFAISMIKFGKNDENVHGISFYLGCSLTNYLFWNAAVPVGLLLGKGVPSSWQLDFAIPLTFMSLLIPSIRERTHVFAAVAAGMAATLGRDLPGGMGMLFGALAGIAAGFSMEKIKKMKSRPYTPKGGA